MALTQPLPAEILAARAHAGHTQGQAADLVYLSSKVRWSEYERGAAPMDVARWELYLLITGQHPELSTRKRSKT